MVGTRAARHDDRYDTPPPRWWALLPPVASAALLVVDLPAGRGRATTTVIATAGYVGFLLVYLAVGWRWHLRHLLPGRERHPLWSRCRRLGPPTRFQLLAPLGVLLFGTYATLLGMRAVDSAASGDWWGLGYDTLVVLLWAALLYRCALATRRLVTSRWHRETP